MGLKFSSRIFDPEHCWECYERARQEVQAAMTPLEQHLLEIIQILLSSEERPPDVEQRLEPDVLANLMDEPWREEDHD